jgi:hypothetical protein
MESHLICFEAGITCVQRCKTPYIIRTDARRGFDALNMIV